MPNLTQLGTSLFLGSVYSVVVWQDDKQQVWVAHHTDRTRNYKTDWTAQKVWEAIEGGKAADTRMQEQWKGGHANGLLTAKNAHNKLKWWQRMKKK